MYVDIVHTVHYVHSCQSLSSEILLHHFSYIKFNYSAGAFRRSSAPSSETTEFSLTSHGYKHLSGHILQLQSTDVQFLELHESRFCD